MELNNTEIIKLATTCVKNYISEMGWKNPADVFIKILDMYEYVIYPEYELDLITDLDLGLHNDHKVLGKTVFSDKTILIDKSIAPEKNDARFVFTLGHEIGHGLMHKQAQPMFRCTASAILNEYNILESQANLFAEHLIMPHPLIKYRYENYYQTKQPFLYLGAGDYCLNGINMHICSLGYLCNRLAKPLTPYFSHVSKESLGYAIYNTGLIKNRTKETIYKSRMAINPQKSCLIKAIEKVLQQRK